jgi:hypothetical protein
MCTNQTAMTAEMKEQLQTIFARMIEGATWEPTPEGAIVGTLALPDRSEGGVTLEIKTHQSAATMPQEARQQSLRAIGTWIEYAQRNRAALVLVGGPALVGEYENANEHILLDMRAPFPCRVSEGEFKATAV